MDKRMTLKSYSEILDVRFKDIDMFGHVNNAVYNEYYEAPRLSLLMYNNTPLVDKDAYYVLRHIEIEFIKEITYPNKVKSFLYIKAIGTTSITFSQALYVGDEMVSRSVSTVVQLNKETKNKQPLSQTLKERLMPYLF